MCYFKETLCESPYGNITISDCQNRFRIEFNNIVLFQNYKSFLAFYDNVDDCKQDIKFNDNEDTRDICFTTKVENLFLNFSKKEIDELHYLLETALIQFEVNV